jgi:hypothetical protein
MKTVLQYIIKDVKNGDFYDYEVKTILKAIKKKKYQVELSKEFYNYKQVEAIYNDILN